jgi:cysteine-rich repeat protein
MRPRWLMLVLAIKLAGAAPAAAAITTCESASADYISSVITSARVCLQRLVPIGRACTSRNRAPDRRANKVNTLCPSGTVARLACTAREAIVSAGLSYATLPGSGFTHLCLGTTCGNGITEPPGEQCDDGNVTNGDGCSATCQLEAPACNDVCAGIDPVAGTTITSQRIVSGLSQPLFVTAPRGDVTRIFIVEKTGHIKIMKFGTLLGTDFLDIHTKVSSGSEQGLLSLAFHPDYANNGRFFVDYTNTAGDTVVAEYHVSPNPDIADSTETVILGVTQPFSNHNGGEVTFGPDGYLYIGLGDGGSGGDPLGNGQNKDTMLGKLLRIDVDSGSPYTSPPTNPFFGATPGLDEIWAFGLRNPWRFSFDRQNGDLYIADVGQNLWEEVDYQPALSGGGENYGWNIMEANHCFNPSSGCDQTSLTLPVVEYSHSEGCSVTGGYAYRGCKMPDLRGTYFYGDWCAAFIRTFEIVGGVATNLQDRTADLAPGGGITIDQITSFGEDARGELYITDQGGEVFKIVPGP